MSICLIRASYLALVILLSELAPGFGPWSRFLILLPLFSLGFSSYYETFTSVVFPSFFSFFHLVSHAENSPFTCLCMRSLSISLRTTRTDTDTGHDTGHDRIRDLGGRAFQTYTQSFLFV
ncbi:hypothetical protein SODALDRAFT_82907 [Sodiomyces alkalinus F11]|uniref:Uncharacterized protein n=1 Tax=Sodiomyces alkalinus (strain CBS 110278 / VKM F-3762 / F11) TaxID=1314773 RepID=A0A3N2PJX4_SODAK|nr:hypothetical protein SODALDRAFT_82907 [Sodiomyces alkalinus F11]ROT34684.1 hypothetical protein SODALDRAFT_82907 [Sodiomyces alkalinus F11]